MTAQAMPRLAAALRQLCALRVALSRRALLLILVVCAVVGLVALAPGGPAGWAAAPAPLFNEFSSAGQPSAVVWDRASALACARRRCFSKSNVTRLGMMMTAKKALAYERRLVSWLQIRGVRSWFGWQDGSWEWQGRDEVVALEKVFEGRSCSVVGGGPFATERLRRSEEIDAQELTIRVNVALPFDRFPMDLKKLPNGSALVSAGLGFGTRTDVLVMNYLAMREAKCFSNLSPNVAEHLRGTIVLFHLFAKEQIDEFYACRKVIREKNIPVRIFVLHPALRLEDARMLLDARKALGTSRYSFATTGFSTVTAAVNLCGSVKAFGYMGALDKTAGNEKYQHASHHSLGQERAAMQRLHQCKTLQRDDLCEKLTLLS